MAYKDKDKQREAQREWVRQKRIDKKGSTKGSTAINEPPHVIPSDAFNLLPKVTPCEIERHKATSREIQAQDKKILASDKLISFSVKPKRGKDIKCFADLPPHVQETIDYMSTTDGKLDKDDKAKRTAAAIHYQHVFPDRYEGTGFSLRTYEDGARQPIGAR